MQHFFGKEGRLGGAVAGGWGWTAKFGDLEGTFRTRYCVRCRLGPRKIEQMENLRIRFVPKDPVCRGKLDTGSWEIHRIMDPRKKRIWL